MTLSGAASASAAHAPFKGKAEYFNDALFNGCYTLKTPVKQHMDLKTGEARLSVLASASNCPAAVGKLFYSEVSEYYSPNALIPVKIGGGNHSLAIDSTARLALNTTVVPGAVNFTTCESSLYSYIDPSNGSFDYNYTVGYCVVQASIDVNAIPILYDATNNTLLYGSDALLEAIGVYNATQVDYGCFGPGYGFYPSTGGCFTNNYTSSSLSTTASVAYSGASTVYINGTFVRSHSYDLFWEIAAQLDVEVSADPGAHAYASIDFGGPGYGIDLKSITVK